MAKLDPFLDIDYILGKEEVPPEPVELPPQYSGIPGLSEMDSPYIPLPPPELNVSSFLPEDIIGQLNQSGWLRQDRPTESGGKPQTFEEQQFILDYMAKYGMTPTSQELKGLQQKGTYDPASTMGQLGFENYPQYVEAQFAGEPFGPLAGETPVNAGIVVTDRQGKPIARYMDINKPEVQRAIEQGRFIRPPGVRGEEIGIGGFPDSEGYYNQPAPYKAWAQPGMEEAIGTLPPSQVIMARMVDYITYQQEQAAPVLRDMQRQYDALVEKYDAQHLAGEIDTNQYNRQIAEIDRTFTETINKSGVMTEAKAKQVIEITQDLISKGYIGQELQDAINQELQTREVSITPDLSGAQTFEGERLMNLYNQAVMGTEVKNKYGDVIGIEGGLRQQWEAEQANQPKPWTGYPPTFEELQGLPPGKDEQKIMQQNFVEYVNSLDTTPEWKKWLFQQYGYYGSLWYESGAPEFLPWLNNLLAGR